MTFGLLQVFYVEPGSLYIESRTEPFIQTTRVDCSNSVNYDWVQVLFYRKHSLFVLPDIGIEPATSRQFHSEGVCLKGASQ